MKEQPLGVLHSISSRGLHENITRSWRGMEDAHLKVPKEFLLDGCMHLSYQILRLFLFFLVSWIYLYLYIYSYRYIDMQLGRQRYLENYLDIAIIGKNICVYMYISI